MIDDIRAIAEERFYSSYQILPVWRPNFFLKDLIIGKVGIQVALIQVYCRVLLNLNFLIVWIKAVAFYSSYCK